MSITPIEVNGDLILSLAATVSSFLNSEEISFEYFCDITKEDRLKVCAKPRRRTLLHEFIENVCCDEITYLLCKHFDEEMIEYMEQWFDSLHVSHSEIPVQSEIGIEEYADRLQALFNDKVLPIISDSVFPILFNNKDFLYKFNVKIAEQIQSLKKDDYPEFFQGDGYLKREDPPSWLKKGVFNRDLGRCQSCGTDLSRIFTNANAENYDHIIPLRQGGSNDPTNFQLMCEHCNKAKQARTTEYRNIVWPYWDSE